ncbi:class III lanthionine synthetase LanKC [Kitasatospora sp. CMC57]|uniref:non-specific serine/threonine protein kinase n=1 Tax=Kitasatospora sp. CMC57 TaxID=3231513 RepID=A0AB33K6L5_9ACTN
MDPSFYDAPTRGRGGNGDFAAVRAPLPAGWVREEWGDWVACHPRDAALPRQGWKIHASASLDNAEEILAAAWDYCVPRGIPFKFLPNREFLLIANAKYAHRGASGKFVTIYPRDEAQLERVLSELGEELDGRAGPYVLSDLRWGRGPLYVRYGAFADRYCTSADGKVRPAIEDGDGRLVPDERGPTFQVPGWIELPGFLRPHLEESRRTTVTDLPYRFDRALHFSNGGGLYAGVDLRSDRRVVLKEARPHAGLTLDGADAVARLGREREALKRLGGLDCVPVLYDKFVLGDHHFLVEEFIEGKTLNEQFLDRYPLVSLEPDDAAFADYTSWAVDVVRQVEEAVAAVHARGVVVGDVHPDNILVRPDGRVALIDFEGASDVTEAGHQALAAPGFVAPEGTSGQEVDDYALACLRLFLFMPLTGLVSLDPTKAGQFAREAARAFPVPPGFLDQAVRLIAGNDRRHDGEPELVPDRQGWLRARDSIAGAVLAAATPEREDRLFPGDIEQFLTTGGGLGLAYGAAGVLYALDVTGAGRHPQYEDWLIRRALHPESGTRMGFYDGLHGVAYVLDHLGHRAEALKALDMCLGERWEQLGLDLHGGLAGIGLNLLHFATATGERGLLDTALQVTSAVADRLGPADGVPELSGGEHPYAGLLRGSAGPALLFVRLYEATGEPEFLELAGTALRQDLRRCLLREDGAMEVNEGFRTMPYLADGSVGIGLVLDDYLTHREDEQFARAAAAIRRAATAPFYLEPGLFDGIAGMILHLSRAHPPGTAAERDPVVAAQVRRLSRYACTRDGRLVFPGEQLMRFSMDLATGSAGVLLALGAALHQDPVHLPFLAPSGRVERGARTDLSDQDLGGR